MNGDDLTKEELLSRFLQLEERIDELEEKLDQKNERIEEQNASNGAIWRLTIDQC